MPHHVLQYLWQDRYFLGVTIALQYPNTEISHSLLQRHISSLHLLTPLSRPRPGRGCFIFRFQKHQLFTFANCELFG